MSGFKSEEQLQFIECEEDLFESNDELISHGINVGDVKKFQQAGNYACNGLMMHMEKAEAGDGVFLNPPLIHRENIERKLFLPNSIETNETKYQKCMPVPYDIPSSLTPKLLLFHPYLETCPLFDPNLYERLAGIKLLETSQIQERATSESMLEDLKRIKESTISEIQEMATSEIELDLTGYELVGSYPGGWLLLVNYARKSFHLYEMSGKWHTLLVYPELTTKKEFIRVCDGVETILFLEMFNRVEMVNGDILIHIFQIQGFDIVIKHQKFRTALEDKIREVKIKHALLCKSLLYMVIRTGEITYLNSMRLDSVGGEVVPRTSDLNTDGLPLDENVFTSMILSPSNTPLLVVFYPSVQFDVFEVYAKEQNELYLLKVTTYNLNLGMQFYLEPNGGGCCVIDPEEPKRIYLATHNKSDCVMGTIEIQPNYET